MEAQGAFDRWSTKLGLLATLDTTLKTVCQQHTLALVAQVHSVVSKMMMEEGFAGSWDQPTRSVAMHNAQPSRLQTLASDLSDRAAGSGSWRLCISLASWHSLVGA